MKARKKPVVVEYIIFTGWNKKSENTPFNQIYKTGEAFSEFPLWLKEAIEQKRIRVKCPYEWEIRIQTTESIMRANEGDYIIKGVNGELYPCKPDIFEKTYEVVSDETINK